MYKTLDDFISYIYDKRSGSKATSDSYYRDIARFITFLNDNEISSLKKVDKNVVFDYVNELRSGNITRGRISNTTYARNLSALRSFYKYLNERHLVDTNPYALVPGVHIPQSQILLVTLCPT